MKIGGGMVSRVYLIDGIIYKRYLTPFGSYAERSIEDHWNRELKALKALSGRKHFPKLISVDEEKKIIEMSYCGVPLTKGNLPDNWENQCKQIERVCKQVSIFHQDFIGSGANPIPPHVKNILVKDGIINIVDFGIWSDGKSPHKDSVTSIIRKVYRSNGRKEN